MRGADYLRDWAMIHFKWHVGRRLEELLTNNVKEISFTEDNLSPANLMSVLTALGWKLIGESQVGVYNFIFYYVKGEINIEMDIDSMTSGIYVKKIEGGES